MSSHAWEAGAHTESKESVRGWLVVVASMIGVAVGLSPVPFYTIGMFAPELSREFGWSFAFLMGSITVQSATVMVASPIAGYLADKYGARPIALISLVLFGLTFMSLSLSNGSQTLYYAQWLVMGFVGAGTLSATWTRVVNGWFDKNRGLALGLASAGTGMTGFLIKPLTAWLITDFGWRTAFVAIGALPIVIGVPVILALFKENRAGVVVEVADAETEAPKTQVVEYGLTLKEALRSHRFWAMAVGFFFLAFALTAPTPNFENILRNFEFSLTEIGMITASFGLAIIVGRVLGGFLLDRFWAPGIAFVILLIPATGCWFLAGDTISFELAMASILFIGFGAGLEFDLLAFLINRYFGQRNYGTIYGCFYTVIALGGGLGPVVYGYAFDMTGTYKQALTVGACSIIIGAGLLLLMGRYPNWNKGEDRKTELQA